MRGGKRQRESRDASHGRPVQKPRLASPANVSKRGLSARPYASHQTPIVVNTRLPKEILTAPSRRVGALGRPMVPFPGPQIKTARLLSQTGGSVAVRIVGALRLQANRKTSGLRLAIGGRGRSRAMLRHEEIELFLVLGVAQPIEEFTKLLLLFLEPPQRLHAVFIEGAVAA